MGGGGGGGGGGGEEGRGEEVKPITAAIYIITLQVLYLGEVSDYVETEQVVLSHDVEEEGIRVIVESLVIQKQFCQQAQVLGIGLGEGGGESKGGGGGRKGGGRRGVREEEGGE